MEHVLNYLVGIEIHMEDPPVTPVAAEWPAEMIPAWEFEEE